MFSQARVKAAITVPLSITAATRPVLSRIDNNLENRSSNGVGLSAVGLRNGQEALFVRFIVGEMDRNRRDSDARMTKNDFVCETTVLLLGFLAASVAHSAQENGITVSRCT